MNESLNASTNPMQATDQNPMETETERLRRLTRAAMEEKKPNKFGPKKQTSTGIATDPEDVIRRAMHDATKVKP